MMAYIANSSYVLQEQKGLQPMPFALFFASTALAQILLSILNAKIVGRRFRPRTLIGFGLTLATLAVAALTVGVFALDTPLMLTCAGFLVLMAVQAFIFGNANALAAAQATHVAGAASAVLGVAQAVAMATSAPIASSGGAATAVPMIWVMIVGVIGSLFSYLVLARPSSRPHPRRFFAERLRSHHASIPCRGQPHAWRPGTAGRHPRSDGARSGRVLGPRASHAHHPSRHRLQRAQRRLPRRPRRAAQRGRRPRDEGMAVAKSNLDTELNRLREIGATADGAVGDPDPMVRSKRPSPSGSSTRSSCQRCRRVSPAGSPWICHTASAARSTCR